MFGFGKAFEGGKKSAEKVEGDPVAAEKFAARLRVLEPGASAKDIEMAANALALKFKDAPVTDNDMVGMYRERIVARPNMPGDQDSARG